MLQSESLPTHLGKIISTVPVVVASESSVPPVEVGIEASVGEVAVSAV